MKRLLDDLLDVARVSQGKIHLQKQRVDLNARLGQAVEISRPMMIEKRQSVLLDPAPLPIALEADPTRLLQVFDNSAQQRRQYTDHGGRRTLSSRPSKTARPWVTVRDDGIGMTPTCWSGRLISPFRGRASSIARRAAWGSASPWRKRWSGMHGGPVRAFSEGSKRGASSVKLPLAISAESHPAPHMRRKPGRRRVCVLIADDERRRGDDAGESS